MKYKNRIVRLLPKSDNDYKQLKKVLESKTFYPKDIPGLYIKDPETRYKTDILQDITLVNKDIETIQGEITSLNETILQLESENATLEADIDALAYERSVIIQQLNGTAGTDPDKIPELNARMAEIDDIISQNTSTIENNLTTINTLTNTISDTQTELDDKLLELDNLNIELENYVEPDKIINPEIHGFDYRQLFIYLGPLFERPGFLIYTRNATSIKDFPQDYINDKEWSELGLEHTPDVSMYNYTDIVNGRRTMTGRFKFLNYEY